MSKSNLNTSLFGDGSDVKAPSAPVSAREAPGGIGGAQEGKMLGAAGGPTSAPPEADPFDLASLRLGQDFGAALGVKKAIVTVPVRKPDKQAFIRVKPGEGERLQTMVLEFKEDRESYLVAQPLWPELGSELKPMVLFQAVTRQGVLFVWPVKLPGADGRADSWSESALEATKLCERAWCRVLPNMGLGGYDVLEAQSVANLPEPEWPDLTLQQVIRLAFKGRMVDSLDHPAIRRLQGAA